MGKYKSTHVSLDAETEAILSNIPERFKSAVIRSLLIAYKDFNPQQNNVTKHYIAMSGNLQLREKILGGVDAAR
jgi:hypothetical protein